MAEKKYASWAAKDTREASSLPSDFDGTITAFQFSPEPPDNYTIAQGTNPLFAHVTIVVDEAGDWKDKSEADRTLKQYYGLGGKSGDEYTISEDGYGLIPNDDANAAIRKGSKFDLFKCSLENEGVPQTITEGGDGSKLLNIRAHFRRVEDEKLLGKKRDFSDKDKREKKFPEQTLVVVKLISMPGEKATSKPTSTAATTGNGSTAASSPVGSLDDRTTSFLMDVIANAKDNKVQRSQLVGLLSKQAIKEKDRQDIARRGSEEEFLQKLAADNVISYDASAKPQIVGLAA